MLYKTLKNTSRDQGRIELKSLYKTYGTRYEVLNRTTRDGENYLRTAAYKLYQVPCVYFSMPNFTIQETWKLTHWRSKAEGI